MIEHHRRSIRKKNKSYFVVKNMNLQGKKSKEKKMNGNIKIEPFEPK